MKRTLVAAVAALTLAAGLGVAFAASLRVTSAKVTTLTAGLDSIKVSTANKSGGQNVAGRPDQNDTLTVEFSPAVSASSLCSAWSGNPPGNGKFTVDIRVTITDGGAGSDVLSATAQGCGSGGAWGTLNLGSGAFVTGEVSYGTTSANGSKASTAEYTPASGALVITLGTVSGAPQQVSTQTTAVYTADPSLSRSSTGAHTAVQF